MNGKAVAILGAILAALAVLVLFFLGGLEEGVKNAPAPGTAPVKLIEPKSFDAPVAVEKPSGAVKLEKPTPAKEDPKPLAAPPPGGDTFVAKPVAGAPVAPAPDPVDPDAPANAATGVRGRVVDSRGAAVAGVTVELRGLKAGAPMRIMIRPGKNGEQELTRQGETRSRGATTDSAGRYEVKGLDAGYRYTLHAAESADWLGSEGPCPALESGKVADAEDLVVKRAATVAGTVFGPDGKPVEGAKVQLGEGGFVMIGPGDDEDGDPAPGGKKPPMRGMMKMMVAAEGPGPGMGMGMPSMPRQARSTRTDAQGRFSFDKVAPGDQPLLAKKKGLRNAKKRLQVKEGDATRDVELRLGEGLKLTIAALDAAGKPIRGAQVSAGFGSRAQETDAKGEVVLPGLSPGSVDVMIEAQGYAPSHSQVTLGEGDERRAIVLKPGVTLVGRVVDDKKAPIAGARIMPEPRQSTGGMSIGSGPREPTKDDGKFRIEGVAPGGYVLRTFAQGRARASKDIDVPEVTGDFDVGDVVLPTLGAVEVTVLDPEGKPAAGAEVEQDDGSGFGEVVVMKAATAATPVDPFGKGRVKTNEAGVAKVEGLEPGTLILKASKSGWADGFTRDVKVAPGEVARATIRLTKGGKLRGLVLDASGAPVAKARVLLLRKNRPGPVGEATSGDDGRFELDHVAAGTVALLLVGTRGEPEYFALADEETLSRTLKKAAGPRLTGTVRSASGSAVAGASVAFGRLDSFSPDAAVAWPERKATTDDQGRFALEDVPAGDFALTVTPADGAATTFRVKTGAGDLVRDVVLAPAAAAGKVRVVARLADGRPAVGAEVRLESVGEGPVIRRSAVGDEQGLATLDAPPGRYTLAAVATGTARTTRAFEVGAGGAETTLALEAGGSIAVEARTKDGTAGLEARLFARRVGDPEDAQSVLARTGAPARIAGLAPGAEYEVTVFVRGRGEARKTLRCEGDTGAPTVIVVDAP